MAILRAALLLILMLPAHGLVAQSAPGDGSPSVVMLAPGDIVRISVWRRPELSGEFAVGPDGTIAHPLYREVRVTARPIAEVEREIGDFLKRFEENPSFSVLPLIRVFVGGEVRMPSVLNVPPGTTVAQAIALAGGATPAGRLDRTTLVRPPTSVILDLTKPSSAMVREEVRSGDQILVARARSVFREYIAPSSSVIGALAALVSIIVQVSR